MKKTVKRTVLVLAALCLAISMCFGMTACKGSLEFKSISVDASSVKTVYQIGDAVDFSDIVVKVAYSDEKENLTLGYSDVTLKYDADITATSGMKTVTVEYADKLFDNATRSATFDIKVLAEGELSVKYNVLSFAMPDFYNDYLSAVDSATTAADSASNTFEARFFEKEDMGYYVGTENAFTFMPKIAAVAENESTPADLSDGYTASVAMSVKSGDAFTELTATANAEQRNTVDFSANGVTYATVNTYTHTYDFTEQAAGSTFRIAISLDSEYYTDLYGEALSALTLDVNVINAYNVTTAADMAALDNSDEIDHIGEKNYGDWKEHKAAKMLGTAKGGIVLHNDINITANDIPSEFVWKYTDGEGANGAYKYSDGTEMSTYIYDETSVYLRTLKDGETFNFIGNFFTVNAEKMPVVASTGVTPDDSYSYGADYSNTQLIDFDFSGSSDVNVRNVDFKGNAHISGLTDNSGKLVYGGGLILMRSVRTNSDSVKTDLTDITFENVISKTFFITYKPETGTTLNLNSIKCYDSNQDAIFAIGDSQVNINDSFMQRAGGPLIILQYRKATSSSYDRIPELIANNSVLESYVSGNELWFSAVGAVAYFQQLPSQDGAFNALGKTILSKSTDESKTGKVNMVALLYTDGTSAQETVGAFDMQAMAQINYGDGKQIVCDRRHDNPLGMATYQMIAGVYQQVQQTPLFASAAATDMPLMLYPYENTTIFMDATTFTPVTDPTNATVQSFINSDYVSFNMGGFGIVCSLFSLQA